MIQMETKLTRFKYLNLKNYKRFNYFSSLKNEQVLSVDKKLGIVIKNKDISTMFNIRGNYKKKNYNYIFQKYLKHKIPTHQVNFSYKKESYLLNLGPNELLYV